MKLLVAAISTLLLTSYFSTVYAKDQIILWQRNYERPAFRDFVILAAEKTKAEYGEYEILPSVNMEQGRAFSDLIRGKTLNLAIAGSSEDREAQHLTIYIPIDRGLLGFKICLITDDNPGFSGIDTVKDFNQKNLLIGAGTHWPDRRIYELNGLRTVHSSTYELLFEMLKRRRFDCFLRSLNEIEPEAIKYAPKGVVAEKHVAFVYPYAAFMFVSKTTPRLKERLEKGLKMAIEDRSFYELFDKHYLDIMKKYDFYNRKLIIFQRTNASPKILDTVNQYGIASFVGLNQ